MSINFLPLNQTYFEQLKTWHENSHIINSWGPKKWEVLKQDYLGVIDSTSIHGFIISFDHKPIGYIQYYWASKVGGEWWQGIDDKTVGIDLFIGQSEYLSKGIGRKCMSEFINYLFKLSDVEKIISDPKPYNLKIIHLLKSLGFTAKGEITTPDGPSLLLELLKR